jgi:hypothetical protein
MSKLYETPRSRTCRTEALIALRAISQWPDGVAALADIEVFQELLHLDHQYVWDGENHVDFWSLQKILDNIAQYKVGKTDSVLERGIRYVTEVHYNI